LLDHSRTLLFALTDGQLPSNVGGGYNLRVILRRIFEIINERKWKISVYDLLKWNAEYLKGMYPELSESVDSLQEIIDVEAQRYERLKQITSGILEKYRGSKLNIEEAARLYESNGISPEILSRSGLIDFEPSEVLQYVTFKHEKPASAPLKPAFNPEGIPETQQLYYDNIYAFDAKVLKVENGYVILDRTAFYPRSGGQEPDTGTLNGFPVTDVVKIRGVIGHMIQGGSFKQGDAVKGEINVERRKALMRHHTGTHIVNAAARMTLGPWVWQNSAFKDEDRARLDITHHSPLTEEQVKKIEEMANRIVMENVKVEKLIMSRAAAESEFGFRIYQGGAVPGNELRIIKIGNYDVEACGGTHVDYTGEIGLIKVLKVERIQDGVDRIEFMAGLPAIKHVQEMEGVVNALKQRLKVPDAKDIPKSIERLESELKASRSEVERILKDFAKVLIESSPDVLFMDESWITRDKAIVIGDQYITNSGGIFIAVWPQNGGFGYIVMVGSRAEKSGVYAKSISEEINLTFHGTGGGRGRSAQGMIRELDRGKLQNILEKYRNIMKQKL